MVQLEIQAVDLVVDKPLNVHGDGVLEHRTRPGTSASAQSAAVDLPSLAPVEVHSERSVKPASSSECTPHQGLSLRSSSTFQCQLSPPRHQLRPSVLLYAGILPFMLLYPIERLFSLMRVGEALSVILCSCRKSSSFLVFPLELLMPL